MAAVAFCIAASRGSAAPLVAANSSSQSSISFLSSSGNWSGYAFYTSSGTTVNSVQGEWVVPAANGSVTPNAYSSFWVGIDGANPNLPTNEETVEQIGTDSDTLSGVPSYYVWYEMYPSGSHEIASMSISPGDTMSASVQYVASTGQFTLSITDLSQTNDSYSQSHSVRNGYTATRSTAEWIAEAPYSGGVLPLSEFGTTTFSGCSASLSNSVSGPISTFSSYPGYDSIMLTPTSSGLGAIPSSLDASGSSFSLATTWPGDVNSDGKVDVNDLTVVLTNYGKTTGMWWATGDLNQDGVVDINDLTIVLSNYGKSLSASAPAVAVPEPSCIALIAGAIALVAFGGLASRKVWPR
jgi:hypothetical protein